MPSEDENVQFLYHVLTHAGVPQMDWPKISAALNLSAGATSKRWSRLRTALDAGRPAGKGAYELLWLCVKHASKTGATDWKAIASACGTTAGAASKRYSRMKQAWEGAGAGANANAGAHGSTPTPAAATPSAAATSSAPPSASKPKRKRAPAKYKPDPEDEDEDAEPEEEVPKKRARRPAAGKKGTGAAVKLEPDAEAAELPTPEASTLTSEQGQGQMGAFHGSGGVQIQQTELPLEGLPAADEHSGVAVGRATEGEGEQWFESREYMPDTYERVNGWLAEI